MSNERGSAIKRLTTLFPLAPDTDLDKLARGISGYLRCTGVSDIAALPVAINTLHAIQTFLLRGADAACTELGEYKTRRSKNRVKPSCGKKLRSK